MARWRSVIGRRPGTSSGIIIEGGPSDPASAADTLGIARSTLEWLRDHLVAQGLVENRRHANDRVGFRHVRPEETVERLAAIEAALSKRFVDRFTRLVDSVRGG